MKTDTILDVDEASFEEDVLRRSETVPVVVDFWAAWCGPCRQLSPVLERLAREARGAWALAKIDVDNNPNIAAAFSVQGIPAVHAFRNGKEVARFVGALPESQVRQWLTQLGPSPAEIAIEEAEEASKRGDRAGAIEAYRRALAHEPGNQTAKAGLARAELDQRTGDVDEQALRARLAADPADSEAVTGLSDIEFRRGDVEAATARLIELISELSGDQREAARLHLLELLDTLPPEDSRALEARRALASVLY
jgi:putative thioredoxin